MVAHGRPAYAEQMGHRWPGFEEERVRTWLAEAGFGAVRYGHLPVDEEAKGPVLFWAAAVRAGRPDPAE
jgi:hypothetical protein